MLHYAGANYGEVSFTAAEEFRAKCSGKFLMVRSAAEKLKLRVVFTFEDWGIDRCTQLARIEVDWHNCTKVKYNVM